MKNNYNINIGDKVLVAINHEVKELEIVDIPDSNPKLGKISFLTPLAKAILGKSCPNRVVVRLPNGNDLECRLLKLMH
ncbi:MAG: GreA/GreB family elongation factor [Candidatus Magasanikbacteria bacterium]|nr:GreA/GreB family elongation factor [Candidatus Magasanikbacteria bacterium]